MRPTQTLIRLLAAALAAMGALSLASAGPARSGALVELDGMKSRAPATWKKQRPSSKMRMAQFELPRVRGDDRDAELVIFYFGPGGGGGTDANIERWKSTFEAPRGKQLDDLTEVARMRAGKAKVTTVDIRGTYLYKERPVDPALKAERRPDHRMIGVIFESERGPYFMRLVGPAKTVAHHRDAFLRWLRGFR